MLMIVDGPSARPNEASRALQLQTPPMSLSELLNGAGRRQLKVLDCRSIPIVEWSWTLMLTPVLLEGTVWLSRALELKSRWNLLLHH